MRRHPGLLALFGAALLLPGVSLAHDAEVAAKPAASAATAQATDAAPAAKADDRKDRKAARAAAAKRARDERQCSMPTSPRLQKKGDDCEQATDYTRWHSRDELDSTGETDTADALRQLNPSIH